MGLWNMICAWLKNPADETGNRHVDLHGPGTSERPIWWLLPEGRSQGKRGPFTGAQLRKEHKAWAKKGTVSIRKGKSGRWIKVDDTRADYEAVVEAAKREAKRAAKAKTGLPAARRKGQDGDARPNDEPERPAAEGIDVRSSSPRSSARQSRAQRGNQWWLLPHGSSKLGPFTLTQLKEAYDDLPDGSRPAIRRDGDSDWVKGIGAETTYPALRNFFDALILETLESHTGEEALPVLRKILVCDDRNAAIRACKAVARPRPTASARWPRSMLRCEDTVIRAAVIQCLGDIGDAESAPGIFEALGCDTEHVRETAVDALGKLLTQAAPTLQQWLLDALPNLQGTTQAKMAECLARVNTPGMESRAQAVLCGLLADTPKYELKAFRLPCLLKLAHLPDDFFGLVLDALEYEDDVCERRSGADEYDCLHRISLDKGDKAVRQLCEMEGDAVNTVLRKVANLKDICLENVYANVAAGKVPVCFEVRRRLARAELARRRADADRE